MEESLISVVLEKLSSKLVTKVFRKIQDIPAKDWLSVYPDVLENYYFFRSLDDSEFSQFSFYYIMVYDGSEAIAATACFFMSYPLETTLDGPLRIFISKMRKILPNIFNIKALICGLPMDQGQIGLAQGSRNPEAIMQIAACLDRIAKENRASILAFKDFGAAYTELLDPIQKLGFYKFPSFPSTEIKINFNTFEDYIKSLSRSSRDSLKRKLKKIDGLNLCMHMEVTNRLSAEALSDVYALYCQSENRGDQRFEAVPMKFFDCVGKQMPEETRFFLWRLDGKLVSFAYCLVSDEHFIDLYLGFDYSIAYDVHLYFIRFCDLMKWCIGHGIKTYDMGQTGYEAKRRSGLKEIPLFIYAKHRNKWINAFIQWISRVFTKNKKSD